MKPDRGGAGKGKGEEGAAGGTTGKEEKQSLLLLRAGGCLSRGTNLTDVYYSEKVGN